jgi:hypothetical protein
MNDPAKESIQAAFTPQVRILVIRTISVYVPQTSPVSLPGTPGIPDSAGIFHFMEIVKPPKPLPALEKPFSGLE